MTFSVRRMLPILAFMFACGPSSRSIAQIAIRPHAFAIHDLALSGLSPLR